jgi:hypothetical protein
VLVGIVILAGCAARPTAGSGNTPAVTAMATSTPASVTALSVASGSVTGGTSVVLKGTGLDQVTAVAFGGQGAPITAANAEQVTVTTPAAVNFAVGPVAVTVSDAKADVATSGITYTYQVLTPLDRQMNYVLTYWKIRNTAVYGSLDDDDCVNFTSQSLLARGWTMDAQWYHSRTASGINSYGSAWISSTALMHYLAARPTLATALTDKQRSSVVVGDIVQFDWDNSGDRDHTGIVTRVTTTDGKTEIYFAGHSLDSDYRSVDTAITVDHPGGTAYYWHLLK